MNSRSIVLAALLPGLLMATADSQPRIFGAATVQEVYRVVLDRNALLLESINSVIKEKAIQDGHVMVTAGSVSECTYHYVTSTAAKPVMPSRPSKGHLKFSMPGASLPTDSRTFT